MDKGDQRSLFIFLSPLSFKFVASVFAITYVEVLCFKKFKIIYLITSFV